MKHTSRPIFISLIPNFSTRDIWRSVVWFFQPWKYKNIEQEESVATALSQYTELEHITLLDSGRTAEYALLSALGIGSADEVIVQAFTCVAVSNAIRWVGAVPVFADIDTTFNIHPESFRARITPRTKAVIVQHTFGAPADLDAIIKIAKERGIVVIEDCAHGLGGSYKGKKLGTWGDAAFFSFGRDKVISGVWGGALGTNNPVLAQKIKECTESFPRHGFLWTARQLLYAPLVWISMSMYRWFGIGKLLHFIFRGIGLLSPVLTKKEKRGEKPARFYKGMSAPLAYILSTQLARIDSFIAHRRQIASIYAYGFRMPYHETCTYLRYPMLSAVATKMRKATARKNIFLGDWYNVIVAPDTVDQKTTGYIPGSCPKAEEVSAHIINLPTHPRITPADATRIVTLYKKYITQWSPQK